MNYRKLRITWSVGCGILGVLLIALWVRSYWRVDVLFFGVVDIGSLPGMVGAEWSKNTWGNSFYYGMPADDWLSQRKYGNQSRILGAFILAKRTILVPYWFVTLLTLCLAVTPWVRLTNWRFSLRTLLIVATLVAVVLRIVIWAAK